MNSTLLLVITESGKADMLMSIAKQAGSTGGTVLNARGTASSSLLCALGLGDSHKEILLTLVSDEVKDQVFAALSHAPHAKGLISAIPTMLTEQGRDATEGWDLVNIICPTGYGDAIMAAARKAGAGGGTIVEGRGTAKEDDIAFFGSTLVAEKELVLILLKKGLADRVLSAVSNLPCMQQKGSGIAFTVSVQAFTSLGA
jgi:nitrogen regulatory protein PII